VGRISYDLAPEAPGGSRVRRSRVFSAGFSKVESRRIGGNAPSVRRLDHEENMVHLADKEPSE
jgi:hypothetical protein